MSKISLMFIDEDLTAQALSIAMGIDTGLIHPADALEILEEMDKKILRDLLIFWLKFDEMTKRAVDRLYEFKERKIIVDYLEKCLEK